MAFHRARLILNPKSGQRGRLQAFLAALGADPSGGKNVTERFTEHLVDRLGGFGIEVDSSPSGTTPQETIRAIQRSVEQGCDLVVVGGGDGTINVAINALAKTTATLAVLPLGTANVFALQMGIPLKIEGALQLIGQGRVKAMDLALCDDRYFSCLCGIGYDAHTMRQLKSLWTKLFGRLAYVAAGLRTYFSYHFRPALIRLDDDATLYRGYIVLVMNGKYYGGRLIVAPEAKVDDGRLDVVVVRDRKMAAVFRYVWGLAQGSFASSEGVVYRQALRIHVLKRGHLPVEVDGEYYRRTPVDIRVVPNALRVIVP